MTAWQRMTAQEKLAVSVSGTVVAFMIVYWITQVVGVIHMLRLAYG